MLLAVVSDTHRDSYQIEKVMKKIALADVLIHLGDNVSDAEAMKLKFKGRVINVRGNCDFGSSEGSELVEEIDGVRIFLTHGHKYDVRNGIQRLRYKAEEENIQIVLFGHTHISMVSYEYGVWFVNPGSASEARDSFESIAMIEIDHKKIHANIVAI